MLNNSDTFIENKYGFESPFKPDPLAKKALTFLTQSKEVLDVGCGEGADTVFYAEQGFQVTAIDQNEDYLNRLRNYVNDNSFTNISILHEDILNYKYKNKYYDLIICLLVGCCMRRSEFEKLLIQLKKSVKEGGIIMMSLRNYLDEEYIEYAATESMIEPNTFIKRDACCKIRYYIEKGRLKELFSDFKIFYYFEGQIPDKYKEVEKHGDSYIICQKTKV